MWRGLPLQGGREVWAQLLHSSQRPQPVPAFIPEDPPTGGSGGRAGGILAPGQCWNSGCGWPLSAENGLVVPGLRQMEPRGRGASEEDG